MRGLLLFSLSSWLNFFDHDTRSESHQKYSDRGEVDSDWGPLAFDFSEDILDVAGELVEGRCFSFVFLGMRDHPPEWESTTDYASTQEI